MLPSPTSRGWQIPINVVGTPRRPHDCKSLRLNIEKISKIINPLHPHTHEGPEGHRGRKRVLCQRPALECMEERQHASTSTQNNHFTSAPSRSPVYPLPCTLPSAHPRHCVSDPFDYFISR